MMKDHGERVYEVHDDEGNVTGYITQSLIDECLNAKAQNIVLKKTVAHLSVIIQKLTAQPEMRQRYESFYGQHQQSRYYQQQSQTQYEYMKGWAKYSNRMGAANTSKR